jgi:hypothetical protein
MSPREGTLDEGPQRSFLVLQVTNPAFLTLDKSLSARPSAPALERIDTSLGASGRKRTTTTLHAGVARIHILGSSIGV